MTIGYADTSFQKLPARAGLYDGGTARGMGGAREPYGSPPGKNPRIRFGNAAAETVSSLTRIKPIKYRKTAEQIGKIFNLPIARKLITSEPGLWNMSIQDWLTRFMLIFTIYTPQAYQSIKNDQHKWETNGRNILTTILSLSINIFLKHDRYSLNALIDPLMQQKGTPFELQDRSLKRQREHLEDIQTRQLSGEPPKGADWNSWQRLQSRLGLSSELRLTEAEKKALKQYGKTKKLERILTRNIAKLESKHAALISKQGGVEQAKAYQGNAVQKLLNRFRLPVDYYDLLRKPEIGLKISRQDRFRALWSSLNALDVDMLFKRMHVLNTKKQAAKLTEEEAKELKTLSIFTRRIDHMKLVRLGLDSALSIMFTGLFLMWAVFRFVAPLDHDFDPDRMPAKLKKGLREKRKKEGQETISPVTPANNANPFNLAIAQRTQAYAGGQP